MSELLDYVCNELKEVEKKTKSGSLSMQEIQYADILAHLKKNLLTAEAMSEGESEYSRDGGSYRRGRDSMGRYTSRDRGYYSRDSRDDLEDKLHELEMTAKDDESRRMIKEWMRQLK